MADKKKKIYKVLKILGKVFLGILILLLLIVLFIRSPWGQNIIKDKFISSFAEKTGTEIHLDKLFIQFNGAIQADGLYIEDLHGDTLVYSESLSANIPIWPIIRGNGFSLNQLAWKNVRANIVRKDSVEGFNYEFLMKVFASDTTQTATPADSTGSSMAISLGDFNLENFNVNYKDGVSGIDSKFIFDDLELEFIETDLDSMKFKIGDAVLSGADIKYNQTHPFPESDSEPPPMPFISLENLKLNNVKAVYDSQPDSLYADLDLQNFIVKNADFNLKTNSISSGLIALNDSDISIKMQQVSTGTAASPTEETTTFTWPDWEIDLKEIDLENNNLNYTVNNAEVEKGTFNPNAIKIDSLTLQAKDISYEPELAKAMIEKLQFQEGSGINVNQFNINAVASNDKIELSNFDIGVNQNSLAGDITISYDDLNAFIENPGEARLDGAIQNINFNIADIYRFQPGLRSNEYIRGLEGAPIRGSLSASGKLDNLSLHSLNINWKNTSISGAGTLVNLQDPENLSFNLPNVRLKTRRKDLLNFVKEEDLGVKLPENISLTGSFQGNTSNIKTNSKLITTDGALAVDGNFKMGDQVVFDAKVRGDSIALGSLLQNDALGDIQLQINASGSGNSVNDLNAKLNSRISSFSYKGYEFRDIDIDGELENGKGPLNLIYQDANLDMEAQTQLALDSVSPRVDFNLYLDGADLGALGISQRNIKTGFTLEGWFEGNSNNYELEAEIIDGVAVYNNKTFLLGNFKTSAFVTPDTTSLVINNRMLDLNLQSNASPAAFSSAINRHFKRYVTENYKEDSIINPVNLKMDAKISEAPILNEVFLVNLEELDTVDVSVDFQEKKRELDASISVPYVNYYNSKIDSLQFNMQSDPSDLYFDFAFKALSAGPLEIKETILRGGVLDRKLNLDFTSIYEGERIVHTNSEINFQGDTLKLHVNPQKLILNQNPWEIDPNNLVTYDTGYLHFQDFRLSRGDQSMVLSNNEPGVEKEHLSLDFKNFKLAALLNYLNPENQLATGNLNGQLVYEDPFGKTGLLADMQINQFKVMDVDLNTLSLKGNSAGFSNYDFEMAISGGEVDLDLTGSYVADEASANLDMNLDLNEVKMTALEGFSQGEIKNGSGSFSGNFSLNGTLAEPKYQGSLAFDQAKFNIAMLNADFILPNEKLRVNNEGVYFDNFNINDVNNNSFVINGEVLTESFLNPKFNLDLKAQNFNLLNSTEEDNDLFYGKATVDVDAKITGDLNLPEVNGNIEINEDTDFTYVVPETELQIKERDGIVIFVNKENPNDILTQTEEESYVISGYDIFSRIKVDEGALFNVIINKETGDKFQVQGEGDLIFNMYPNGRLSLSGVYEINNGFYEMSLYNLVKRRFDIADGSRVSWAGDPFEAQLDVRAIYRVQTSASSLMAPELSGTDPAIAGKYRQQLPFLVYLNVAGELTEPKISFGIDMPEDDQGAVGGQVYGRIQQLNSQEQELNKQVFSLLVLNRFFPGGGNDGSSGGTLAVARDNLNEALSDQLNMLSSKIMGESGVQLNFQVDSYTDYQGESPQERTQLDINAQKAFLEDRLIVQVGSEVDIQGGNQPGQESSPVIGNVSIAYLLDEDGVWRLKGFRRNQYENVIDGQLIISGISLIFTKEFNKFKELFEKAVIEEAQKEQAEIDKAEETTKENDEN